MAQLVTIARFRCGEDVRLKADTKDFLVEPATLLEIILRIRVNDALEVLVR